MYRIRSICWAPACKPTGRFKTRNASILYYHESRCCWFVLRRKRTLRTEGGLRPTRHPPIVAVSRDSSRPRGGREDFALVLRIFFSRNESSELPSTSFPGDSVTRESVDSKKYSIFLDRSRFCWDMLGWTVGLASWTVED